MPFHLTPANLVAAYELLCTCPPFRGWKMPHSDEIAFKVSRCDDPAAQLVLVDGQPPLIEVSAKCTSTLTPLLRYMAHEMTHLHEHTSGEMRSDCMHGAPYRRRARRVCSCLSLDPMEFGGLE